MSKKVHGSPEMFNQRAASPESKTDHIIKALRIEKGWTVADIGAGGGYFAGRFSEAVGPSGKVIAIDNNPGSIKYVSEYADKYNLKNIQTILTSEGAPDLPVGTIDLVFFRNVFHHLDNRAVYLRKLKGSLRQGGRLAVIEHKKGGLFSFTRFFGHYVPKMRIISDMEQAGYNKTEEYHFLPDQSFTVYGPQ